MFHLSESPLFDGIDKYVAKFRKRTGYRKHGYARTDELGEVVQQYEAAVQHDHRYVLEQVVLERHLGGQLGARACAAHRPCQRVRRTASDIRNFLALKKLQCVIQQRTKL